MAKRTARSGYGLYLLAVIACILAEVLLLVGSGVLGWFLHKWTKGEAPEEKGTEGGMVITAPVEGDISLTSAPLPIGEYEAYDVSPAAESARQVSASFKDEYGAPLPETDAAQVKLEWSLAWLTGTSWGAGKTVSEYVTLSVGEDTHTATLSCLQPFGEEIVLKAAVKGDESVSGTVFVDYRQRYKKWHTVITFPEGAATAQFGENEVDHTFGMDLIDFTDELEALSWEDKGTVQFVVDGTDVYTLPLTYTVVGFQTKCSSPQQITAAGGRPRSEYAAPIGARYDDHSHIWYDVNLEDMLGMSVGNKALGFTLKKYRSALAEMAAVTAVGSAAVYEFVGVTVNGERVEDDFEFGLAFNPSSLYITPSSVELTPGNIEL